MADEELYSINVDHNEFDAALDAATKAAEQFAQRVNSAFGNVKQPTGIKEGAEKIGEGLKKASEQVGSFARDVGSAFGEGGSKLGEFAEAAANAVGGLGAAFLSLRGEGAAAGKELEAVAEGAAKAEAGAAGAAQAVGGLSGILSKLGPLGGLAAGVGAGALGLFGFAVEKAEEYEKLAQASGTSYENFAKLAEVGAKFDISVNELGGLLANVNSQFHEAAIASREIAERWSLLQDRIQVVQDRIKQGAVERAEAEHGAVDQARESQHAIQQATQARFDAEKRLQEATEAFQRHGRPLSRTEEADKAEKQRLSDLQTAERGLAEARRSEAEAQHKAQDDARKADEERSSRALQAQREQVLLERFTTRERLEQLQIRERSSPLQRAFLAEGEAQGVTNFADNLKRMQEEVTKFDASPLQDKLKRLIEAIESLPDGAEKTRLLNQNFGELAKNIVKHGADIAKALTPEELEKFGSSFPSHEKMEQLAEDHRKLTENLLKITNAAVSAGGAVSTAFGAIGKYVAAGGAEETIGPTRTRGVAEDKQKDATKEGAKAIEKKADVVVQSSKIEIKAIDSVTGALVNQAETAKRTGEAIAKARGADRRIEGRTSEEIAAGSGIPESVAPRTYEPAKIIDVVKQLAAIKPLPSNAPDAESGALVKDNQALDAALNAATQSTKNFSDAIPTVKDQVSTFGDALEQSVSKLRDFLSTLSSGSGGSGHAGGGYISGAGSGTSDSITARLSHGEYVVRSSAVAGWGRSFMDRVNAGPGFSLGGFADAFAIDLPRFQAGGYVNSASPTALHPVTIVLPNGQSITGLHAGRDAVDAISQHAVIRQASSAGRKPSSYR